MLWFCGKVHRGMNRKIPQIKDHIRDIDYKGTEKSSVAKHAKHSNHIVDFGRVEPLIKEKNDGKSV